MQRVKLIIGISAAVLIAVLSLCGAIFPYSDVILGGTVFISTAVTLPDGRYNWSFDVNDMFLESADNGDSDISEEHFPLSDSDGNEQGNEIHAVNQTLLGHIVKQTLSPYNVNTSYSDVYLNNSCKAKVDVKSLLTEPLQLGVKKTGEPQILIYHTHATEGYMEDESQYYTDFDEPRTTDTEKNVVAIGERIKHRLEAAGFAVIHDQTLHDHPGYSGSYSRSSETVKSYLSKYPSIKIVIDVHRDSISSGTSDKVAPVVSIDGKEAAQVMLVMGSQTGDITDHPNWQKNLNLAVKLQYLFESNYPQLARAILLRSAKYNQNLSSGAFLIEVGSDANTFSQAMYSADLVGQMLTLLLESQ